MKCKAIYSKKRREVLIIGKMSDKTKEKILNSYKPNSYISDYKTKLGETAIGLGGFAGKDFKLERARKIAKKC